MSIKLLTEKPPLSRELTRPILDPGQGLSPFSIAISAETLAFLITGKLDVWFVADNPSDMLRKKCLQCGLRASALMVQLRHVSTHEREGFFAPGVDTLPDNEKTI